MSSTLNSQYPGDQVSENFSNTATERTMVGQLNQSSMPAHGTMMHSVPIKSTSALVRTDMR